MNLASPLSTWSRYPPPPPGEGSMLLGDETERVEESAAQALESLSQRLRIDRGTFVEAAWALLLARHSGLDEVTFGVRVQGAAGDAIQTRRVSVQDMPLPQFLAHIAAQQSAPQDPRARLMDENTAFSLVTFETDTSEAHHTLYPLVLCAASVPSLSLRLRFNTQRFEPATAQRLLVHLRTLLEGMAAQPESSLALLPMLPAAERRMQLAEWNETSSPYPREATVQELFEKMAQAAPSAMALEFGDQRISYLSLNRRADHLAAHLTQLGLAPGGIVAIRVERSVAMVVGFLAILKAGGAYLPLDVADPARRVEAMLKDSGAQFLLTQEGLPSHWPDFSGAVILLDADGNAPSGTAASARPPAPARTADDVAYVIYTSGSTGQPKGICIKHRGITRLVLGTNFVRVESSDRIAQASNASFDAATFEIWGALLNGACLVGIPRQVLLAPQALAAALREQRISVLFLTTALFNQLVRQVPDIFSPLRCLLFGGEAVSPRWVRTALQHGRPRQLLHVYGPTECTTYSTWHEIDQASEEADTIPIGRPIANSTAYVLDRDLQLVPAGAPGELCLGGDGLAAGYLGRPDLTAERFIRDPFSSAPNARLYRTGDLVRQRSDGALVFLGRLDDQVKIDGHRIEPAEIEHVLRGVAGVHDCRVLVRTGPAGQRRLAAYLVTGLTMHPDSIRPALAERLPPYLVPHFFFFLSALPITSNGKLDQAALPDPFALEVTGSARVQAPELELVIAAWTEVLGRRPAAEDLNFFDAGGTSLEAVQLHDVLTRRLGRSLDPAFIFEHATIRRQAEALAATAGQIAAAPGGRGQQRRRAQGDPRRRRTP